MYSVVSVVQGAAITERHHRFIHTFLVGHSRCRGPRLNQGRWKSNSEVSETDALAVAFWLGDWATGSQIRTFCRRLLPKIHNGGASSGLQCYIPKVVQTHQILCTYGMYERSLCALLALRGLFPHPSPNPHRKEPVSTSSDAFPSTTINSAMVFWAWLPVAVPARHSIHLGTANELPPRWPSHFALSSIPPGVSLGPRDGVPAGS